MGRPAKAAQRPLLRVAGQDIATTAVYDTYWDFATKRQDLFVRRVTGQPKPWTDDPVLASHRFTNAYRASDRVSQFLIRNVIYSGSSKSEEVFFRTLLFKVFNKVETWQALVEAVGTPSWKTFRFESLARALDGQLASGKSIYSAAYIMPSPPFGNARKHRNHLQLLEHMMRDGAPAKIARAKSLSEVFSALRSYPSLGDFLAFQFAIDLNYSELIDFSEMEFVVAGPGAKSGISKCFANAADVPCDVLIRAVAEAAEDEFSSRRLSFHKLWGRPLQLIDCQNLFCEVDKYARVVHPEYAGSGRTRIKQRFAANPRPLPQWYPPKWGLNDNIDAVTLFRGERDSAISQVSGNHAPAVRA
jgi:hypothetical protein